MIKTKKLRRFRLVRRLSTAIAIKVSGSGIRRVNFAMPCVVPGAPSRDLAAHAQPLQKSTEMLLLRGIGTRTSSHRIPMIVPIVRSSRYEGPGCSGCSGNHSDAVF